MSLWPLKDSTRRSRRRHAWGLGTDQLAWQGTGAAQGATAAPLEDGLAQALALTQPGDSVDIVAANELASFWLQPPPAALQSFYELRQVAAARCAHLFGGAAGDWWVAGDWHARRPFACAALPMTAVHKIQAVAGDLGLEVRWHSVWALLCAKRAQMFSPDGWSALRSPRRVVLWECRAGEVTALASVHVGATDAQPAVAAKVGQLLQLEMLCDPDATTGEIRWFDQTKPETVGSQGPSAARLDSEPLAALGLHGLLEGRRS